MRSVSFSLPYICILTHSSLLDCRCFRLPFGCISSFGQGLNLYSKTLQNGFPGNCRSMPFLSKLKSVARTSLEFNPVVSTS